MRNIYFTSDTHFNHKNIIKFCQRPFEEEAIHEMDEEILEQINSTVNYKDVLWHLGDFCFANSDKYYDVCSKYRSKIRCRNVNFIWGNHDNRNILPLCGFQSHHDLIKIGFNRKKIVLCHYAMLAWQGSHKGYWHLYGHSHSNLEDWANEIMPTRKSIDVGVDNALKLLGKMRPFSFDEISDQFK